MARWQDGKWNFKLSRAYAGNFFLAKVFFLRTHEGFAKNAILSCHLAIFVSLIPFLKGVGCRMASENSKSRIRGRAGRNVRRLFFPARPPTHESLQKRHFKLPSCHLLHLLRQWRNIIPPYPKERYILWLIPHGMDDFYLALVQTLFYHFCILTSSFFLIFLFLNSYFAFTAVGYPILIW